MNQMKNYDECMLILRTFDKHIKFNAIPSKRSKFAGSTDFIVLPEVTS